MIDFNFDAPDTKSGFCPVCESHASIWDDKRRVWECDFCNWSGKTPAYTITKAAKDRHEYGRISRV